MYACTALDPVAVHYDSSPMSPDTSPIDQRTPHTSGSAPNAASGDQILLELIREMRTQRDGLQAEHRLAESQRRTQRRWQLFFQGIFFTAPLILGLLSFAFILHPGGLQLGPFTEVVAVVHLDGQISPGAAAGADHVIPALERAFAHRNVKGVIMAIDSPGGAPVEAERINAAITTLKKKHHKPFVAVIHNVGASAAYMVAMHADKIVAGKYSLVGSIGAIMAPWDLHRAIARLDVSQRVYASGRLKAFLNPFTPVTPEVDAKAQKLVDQMGQTFLRELQSTRGAHLKHSIDYASGEVWSGLEAKELGLVDAIGTQDDVAASDWGLESYNFGPHQDGFGAISSRLGTAVSGVLHRVIADPGLQLH